MVNMYMFMHVRMKFIKTFETSKKCRFFVIAMAIVGGYLVLSLPFSIVSIVRPQAVGPRVLLLVLDTVINLFNLLIQHHNSPSFFLAVFDFFTSNSVHNVNIWCYKCGHCEKHFTSEIMKL